MSFRSACALKGIATVKIVEGGNTMSIQYLLAKTGRKTGKFLGLTIGILALLLLSWGVSFAGIFVPYDDFSASPTVINKAKWGQYESIREISGGQLRLKQRSSRHDTSNITTDLSIQTRSPSTPLRQT